MPATRITITLDPGTADLLRATGNASGYIVRLVQDAAQAWRHAHAQLHGAGWRPNEILCAIDALNGAYLLEDFTPLAISPAHEMHDAEGGEKWDIAPARHRALVAEADDPRLALALRVLAREFWRGNEQCESVIRKSTHR